MALARAGRQDEAIPFLDAALELYKAVGAPLDEERLVSSAADAPDRFHREAEEGRESVDPLLEKLATVNQDQCVHTALGD